LIKDFSRLRISPPLCVCMRECGRFACVCVRVRVRAFLIPQFYIHLFSNLIVYILYHNNLTFYLVFDFVIAKRKGWGSANRTPICLKSRKQDFLRGIRRIDCYLL